MIRLFLFLFLILTLSQVMAEPSSISLYSISAVLKDDTLHKTIEIHGIQGSDRLLSRISHGFNPETQSVEIEEAVFGFPGTESGPVPEWAIDSLSGTEGWQLSLVVAFPALREGMEIRYRIIIRDWSNSWKEGPWAIFSPSVKGIFPDSCFFSVQGDIPVDLQWSDRGYIRTEIDDGFLFTSTDSAAELWITPFCSFDELGNHILMQADDILNRPHPPDLREAALQTTSAGADEWFQTGRARSLICNSIGQTSAGGGSTDFKVRSLQEILNSRTGTPLEIAVLFAAMCHELGIQASILPATELYPELPVPDEWNRFLVRVKTRDGRSWLMEPSAYLTPAFFIFRPDTLYVLDGSNLLSLTPNSPYENSFHEEWGIDSHSGTFRLKLTCSGWYDMLLRRKFAGLTGHEMILVLSEWSWRSGRLVIPDSVSISDPFDLGHPLELFATGQWSTTPEGEMYCDYLPMLNWHRPLNLSGNQERIWNIAGNITVSEDSELLFIESADTATLIDTIGITGPVPVLFRETQ